MPSRGEAGKELLAHPPLFFTLQDAGARRDRGLQPGVPRAPSDPAIAAEVQAQCLLFSGAQPLQWGTAGSPIVAEPVHGFLQPWDSEAPGHLKSKACDKRRQKPLLIPTQVPDICHLQKSGVSTSTPRERTLPNL